MEISVRKCYIVEMNKLTSSSTAEHIRTLARTFNVSYTEGPNDRLAHHISRLAGDMVELDEIEQLLIGLQRAKRCRPERGWNSVWRIPGDMKLSFHAARSIG
jgi:hypothetical protein